MAEIEGLGKRVTRTSKSLGKTCATRGTKTLSLEDIKRRNDTSMEGTDYVGDERSETFSLVIPQCRPTRDETSQLVQKILIMTKWGGDIKSSGFMS